MLSVAANNIAAPVTPSLVATSLPNTSAARVPYDNVVPSVSNAKVDNNASSNRNPLIKTESQATPQSAASEEAFSLPANNTAQNVSGGNAQTAFLAQLAAQDSSPTAKVILVQYEKLVSYGAVKYRPSDAGKPSISDDLSNLFAQALRDEKPVSVDAPAPVEVPAEQVAAQPVAAANDDVPQVAQAAPAEVAVAEPVQEAAPAPRATPQVAAYTQTVRRNEEAAKAVTSESA